MSLSSLRAFAVVLVSLGVGVGGIAAVSMGPASGPTDTVIAPHRLNLDSHGNFVTAVLKNATDLADDLAASDLTATASVLIDGADVGVAATVRAYDGANDTVVVKIDRQEISAAIADALGSGGTVDDPLSITVSVSGGGASVTRTGTLDWFRHP